MENIYDMGYGTMTQVFLEDMVSHSVSGGDFCFGSYGLVGRCGHGGEDRVDIGPQGGIKPEPKFIFPPFSTCTPLKGQ